MNAKDSEPKRRPTPIKVPAPPLLRIAPGPNAFAIMEAKAKREEMDRQTLHLQGLDARSISHVQQQHPAFRTPTSPLDDSQVQRAKSQIRKDEGKRATAMNTFSNLIEQARATPSRKSDGHSPSTTGRHASTARSRHSQRSNRSAPSTLPGDDENPWNEKTARGYMESRSEKKLLKIMNQIPGTPPSEDASMEGTNVTKFEYTTKIYKASGTSNMKVAEAVKSPKKKIFGMSIPSFRSSTSASATPAPSSIPTKAAQILGTSPQVKLRNNPRPRKSAIRSDTSKSLPYKLYDHHSSTRHPHHHRSIHAHNGAGSHPPSIEDNIQWEGRRGDGVDALSMDDGPPPTPPDKDTPKDTEEKMGGESRFKLEPHARAAGAHEEVEHGKEKSEPGLSMKPGAPMSFQRGTGPTKIIPFGPEDYAKLAVPEPVKSVHAQVDHTAGKPGDGIYSAPLEGDSGQSLPARQGRWSEEDYRRLTQMGGGQLRPAFYTPSNRSLDLDAGLSRPSANADPARYFLALKSKDNVQPSKSGMRVKMNVGFDPTEATLINDTEPASNLGCVALWHQFPNMTAQNMPTSEPEQSPDGQNDHSKFLHPEQSASRLTEMLGGVSPSRNGYNNFYANHPSAMPSPLYGNQDQQVAHMPHPMMGSPVMSPHALPGTLSDGSNILTHFYMTNQHLDVLGCSMHDMLEDHKREQTNTMNTKHNEIVAALESRVEEIKSHIGAIGDTTDSLSAQSSHIIGKVDQLADFIKEQVVDPLSAQAQKTAVIEQDIKALQKSMQALQKLVEAKSTTTPAQPQVLPTGQLNFPLPNHRSQPSLAGFYGSPPDASRNGPPRLPPIQDTRNDGRFQYNNSHNYYRSNMGGENKDSTHHGGLYENNGAAQWGGGMTMGGFPGYSYPSYQTDQNYNFNPGASK
ncbi:uncharacterized protein BDR25DRAFT_338258 [Lindgomyces ingoldianus]|uniref:Uncharacterized protein n=1 Tax=Lindgomyces ingoldianus TaxID=673940 RepID=A0ACB6RDQ8_9PLEO|nr:uncharacterized protein BDR25DRAFT_338258 [Lindgomyces ingoldianus]KAF2477374.1 hypothetical protein BDR25DRAFT_338258 [Lindgomyces ingoldianus]